MSRSYLILSYFYPPENNPRALRWKTLAEYWAKRGYCINVISGWEAGWPREEWLNGVYVYRVDSLWLGMLRGWVKRSPADVPDSEAGQRLSPRRGIRSFVRAGGHWIYHHVYRHIYWPDGGYLWYLPALRQARKLLAKQQYDALITVSHYFTAHLIGRRLRSQFESLPWLVDMGDPFSFLEADPENNTRLYKRLNRWVERDIFRHATTISVTTSLTKAAYADLFPESFGKIHVIPPLLAIPPEDQTIPPTNGDKLRLVFTGRMYPDVRRPDFLLRLFRNLLKTPLAPRLELHMYGSVQEVFTAFNSYRDLIGSKIFLHGFVPHAEVMQVIRTADVLINIGNRTVYQLPSKVVEYISTGKPLINLASIKEDSSSLFFAAYPSALTLVDQDEAVLVAQTQTVYHFLNHLPSQVSPETIRQLLTPYQVEAIAEAYDKIIPVDRSGSDLT